MLRSLIIWASIVGISALSAATNTYAGFAELRPLQIRKAQKPAITDDQTRTVLLRGANLNTLGDYYQANPEMPTKIPASQQDYAEMASLGFNVVRLVLSWSALEPTRGQLDPNYLEAIRTHVGYAKSHGMYTVLDMHQDAWGKYIASTGNDQCGFFEPAIGWDGAPAWATITDGASTCRFPGLREMSPAVARAFENFWRNRDGIQDALIDTWAKLAAEFATEPAVAGYDLLNEPNFGLSVGFSQTLMMGGYYTKALRAIRKAEAAAEGFHHIAFFEPSVEWSAFGTTLWPIGFFLFDSNIVFAPHLYSGSITVIGTIESGYAHAAQAAQFYRTPFWSGEWGWFGEGAEAEASVWRYAQMEDQYQIGGAVWQWKQACGDPHPQKVWNGRPVTETQNQVNLIYCPGDIEGGISPVYQTVLSRAYPKNAPGQINTLNSNPYTGEFLLTGSTDSSSTAIIWVPASQRQILPEVQHESSGPLEPGDSANTSQNASLTISPLPGGYEVSLKVSGEYTISIQY